MRKREPTTDGVEIMHRRYFEGKPEMLAALDEERVNLDIALQIYNLREQAGLTQQQLADRVGTDLTTIVCLEDADYDGDARAMLRRIEDALKKAQPSAAR